MEDEAEAQRAVAILEEAETAAAAHRFADAIALARSAATIFFDVDGSDSPDGANALMTAGGAHLARSSDGDLSEAADLYARAADTLACHASDEGGPLDVLLLRARRGVGTVARTRGQYADAATALAAALEHAEAAFGPESAEAGYVCNDLGVLGKFTAAFDDAARWYARALAIAEQTAGPRSDAVATLHHNLAGLAHSRRRAEDGLTSGRLSVEIRRELLGDDHVDVAADRANLGGLLMDVGAIDEAEECFDAARRTYEQLFGPDHLEVAIAWNNLAAVAEARGDRGRAIEFYRRALELKTAALGERHPSTLVTAVNLGYAVADAVEARTLFQRAIDGLSGVVGPDDRTLAAARQGLADRAT